MSSSCRRPLQAGLDIDPFVLEFRALPYAPRSRSSLPFMRDISFAGQAVLPDIQLHRYCCCCFWGAHTFLREFRIQLNWVARRPNQSVATQLPTGADSSARQWAAVHWAIAGRFCSAYVCEHSG